jgi:putative phosphoribosyl transferase
MYSTTLFRDRDDAGFQLATSIMTEIKHISPTEKIILYGLPRGGVPVAVPTAKLLNCPLQVIVSKKITLPSNPELAIGAVTADGEVIWYQSNSIFNQLALDRALIKAKQQFALFNVNVQTVEVKGAIAIIIDDGIATGMTMAVAAQSLRKYQPKSIFVCAPVGPINMVKWLKQYADQVIILCLWVDFMIIFLK